MLLSIPSPAINAFELGPFTIRFYALTMITGIVVAYLLGVRRWRARGGSAEAFETIVLWAIPLGIIGARAYHVATHWQDYFAPGINPMSALYIWEGGIAVFGSLMGGAIGALIGARQTGTKLLDFGDAIAPGLALAQAIGRIGNWFNQELFGGPSTLPWAVEIDPMYRPPGLEAYSTFHPTFLYELILNLAAAGLLLWLDRRFRLGHGQVFYAYMACYGMIRFLIEGLRTDFSYYLGPLRTNQVMALAVLIVGLALFAWSRRRHDERSASTSTAETNV